MEFMDADDVIVIDSESDSGEEQSQIGEEEEEELDVKPEIMSNQENMNEDTVNMADSQDNIFMGNATIAEDKKKLGNEQYKAQNYDAALKLYSDAISLCPDSAQYYGNRAACYMMQSNYTLALNDARHAVRLDPNFDKAYARIAKCCLTLGDIVGADLAIKKSLELSPQNHSILYEKNILNQMRDLEGKIKTVYDKRDYRSVVYYVDNMLKLAPACVKYRLMKGECLAFLGRYEEALDLAVSVMKVDTTSAEAIYLRGLCLYFTDNLDKAIQHFQHTLQLDPDHVKAKDMRNKTKVLKLLKDEGNVLYKNQRYADAYRTYTDALKIDELNTDINSKLYYNRALVSSKMNKLQEAVNDCTKVLTINPDYLKAILLRARCYSELEMFKECVADYEVAVQKHKSPEMKRLLRDAKFALKKSLRVDYYKILGVGKNATTEEIKSNYKKKAMLHHPDRHTNSTAEQRKTEEVKFKEISEAYNVLIDPTKRQNYDNGIEFGDNESFDSQMKRNFFFFTGGGSDEYRYGY